MQIIDCANTIIEKYQAMGLILTLRQLYYQFVAHDHFEKKYTLVGSRWVLDMGGGTINAEPNYKMLGSVINDARLAGLIDWDAMEDRTRELVQHPTWNSPQEIIKSAYHSFRRDLWERQPNYVEVWVEKDALVGVIEAACKGLRVPFFACRGYTSQSSQHEASMRLSQQIGYGRKVTILHLGDHDPSGIDMTRDNTDRLRMFIEHTYGDTSDVFAFKRLALNMDQIELYQPPPNPAKAADSRFDSYVDLYGDTCWELDALEPSVMRSLIEDEVSDLIDPDLWEEDEEREERERDWLLQLSQSNPEPEQT
jgi:hypothetical protein